MKTLVNYYIHPTLDAESRLNLETVEDLSNDNHHKSQSNSVVLQSQTIDNSKLLNTNSFTSSIGYYRNRTLSRSDVKLFTNSTISTRSESVDLTNTHEFKDSKTSPWDILCKIINCKVAFKKQFNGKKYNWIQLAGHAGRFKPGEREGYILKLMDNLERTCLETLQTDHLANFVPRIDKVLLDINDDNYYTEMQDLLYSFNNPSIMDIKIGVRTFLEVDANDKESIPRNDLYVKIMQLAPEEPTELEHQLQAMTKRRYMSWREKSTCSATLGFRIEAIKKNQVKEREFYSVKEKHEVQSHIVNYTDNKKFIMKMYLDRLIDLKEHLKQSEFFSSHEMIGSSLLFVHDDKKANIWMIDFGKTRPLPNNIKITHDKQWQEGNHEDGYLIGIENLIDIFREALEL